MGYKPPSLVSPTEIYADRGGSSCSSSIVDEYMQTGMIKDRERALSPLLIIGQSSVR